MIIQGNYFLSVNVKIIIKITKSIETRELLNIFSGLNNPFLARKNIFFFGFDENEYWVHIFNR